MGKIKKYKKYSTHLTPRATGKMRKGICAGYARCTMGVAVWFVGWPAGRAEKKKGQTARSGGQAAALYCDPEVKKGL